MERAQPAARRAYQTLKRTKRMLSTHLEAVQQVVHAEDLKQRRDLEVLDHTSLEDESTRHDARELEGLATRLS
jgi:hypothetical protein